MGPKLTRMEALTLARLLLNEIDPARKERPPLDWINPQATAAKLLDYYRGGLAPAEMVR